MKHGHLTFEIEALLKSRGISKNQLCKDMDIPRSNLNRYCQNKFERIDAQLVCKLCRYLNIDVGTLITYHSPDEQEAGND
ncbi:MAG: helix-turn-helix transcriptional regulator [Oscillospiraceae bacterium]|nr:helix-turn-helix transcriptional regulator [Oscillospiraceae bacterium]